MSKETLKEFRAYLWKKWLVDVIIRMVKTGAEVFLGYITIGAMISDIDWLHALSVTGTAMIYTIVVNIYRIASDLEKTQGLEAKDEDLGSGH